MEYVQNDHIVAVGGSFIISESAIKKDDGKTADKILKTLVDKIRS